MKKTYLILFASLLFLAVIISSEAVPVKFSVKAIGVIESVVQNETTVENCALNPDTNATECINETITVNNTVSQPWSDSASIDIECGSVCTYPMPSFDSGDAVISKYEIKYSSSDAMV